ncbi:MAG: D-alanyl-D-alanine carboxypeptidase family protein [Propionibacteriaceae bacterium]|nr:D-alanyl-D-alanine carboxypeptidase family protein [Micropruina sp.]HBY23930.1 hypothetical protein [Propionibacteriaceae bacterium]
MAKTGIRNSARGTRTRSHRTPLTATALAVAVITLTGCQGTPATPGSASPATEAPTASVSAPSETPTMPAGTPVPADSLTASPSATSATTAATGASSPDGRTGAALDTPFTKNGIIVINKAHWVSENYAPLPDDQSPLGMAPEAKAAFDTMNAAAKAARITLVIKDGYHTYAYQAQMFAAKVKQYGSLAEAKKWNALPGQSEHESGLAIDLYDGKTWGTGVAATATGKWLWANAYKYGFILRYPPNKQAITGYPYEAWHYRYIGAQASAFGANSTLTLEEYLGVT